MLNADRATLFLNDEKTNELFSRVAMGEGIGEIRLPNTAGIAGSVFTSGETMNIPYAYADLRFNPSFDKQTGYFTRSILCVPVINKNGKVIGCTQVLNKKGGKSHLYKLKSNFYYLTLIVLDGTGLASSFFGISTIKIPLL